MEYKRKLKGKVAVVAGATRGAGRGIACMLGEAGAYKYHSDATVDRAEVLIQKEVKRWQQELQ